MTDCTHIVSEAREWLGTPFHHQGRLKRVGADCIGMVLGVLHNAGVRSRKSDAAGNPIPLTAFDQTDYAPDPNSQRLKHQLDEHFDEIQVDQIRAGDVLLFKIIHLPQHVAIVCDHPSGEGLSIIHAYSPAQKVVEEALHNSWLTRIIAAYRVPPECFGGK